MGAEVRRMLWTLVGIVLLIVFGPIALGVVGRAILSMWDAIGEQVALAAVVILAVGACIAFAREFGAAPILIGLFALWLWVCWKAVETRREARRQRARNTPQFPPDRVA